MKFQSELNNCTFYGVLAEGEYLLSGNSTPAVFRHDPETMPEGLFEVHLKDVAIITMDRYRWLMLPWYKRMWSKLPG